MGKEGLYINFYFPGLTIVLISDLGTAFEYFHVFCSHFALQNLTSLVAEQVALPKNTQSLGQVKEFLRMFPLKTNIWQEANYNEV